MIGKELKKKKVVIRMFNTFGELREQFNKELENVIKNQTEIKNMMSIEMKNVLERINNRVVILKNKLATLKTE